MGSTWPLIRNLSTADSLCANHLGQACPVTVIFYNDKKTRVNANLLYLYVRDVHHEQPVFD